MKENLLKSLLSIVMILTSSFLFAHDFEVDSIYYNIISETERTVEVTFRGDSHSSYTNEYENSVRIPLKVKFNDVSYTVTSVGDSAFYSCGTLDSVTIPNSITSIGRYAFYNCGSLNLVTIGNSVTTIGDYAFFSCSSLTSITIPNSVTSIGGYAFRNCSGLTSITIPNSVTSIGYSSLGDCDNLKSIVVESGNTTYDSRDNCNAIIETATNTLIQGCNNSVIPNSVTSIGKSAFAFCESLTSVTIPESIRTIGDIAFSNCTGLTSIEIPNSVTTIGNQTFYGCI